MSKIETQLASLTEYVRLMEERVPPALKIIAEHLSELDGMSRGGDGASVSTSLGSSTTERAALMLATGRFTKSDLVIREGIRDIAVLVHRVLNEAQHLVPVAEQPRCNRGTGRVGQLEWNDPLCEEYAAEDRGGLCYRCAANERAWRVERGMSAREVAERDGRGRFARGAA